MASGAAPTRARTGGVGCARRAHYDLAIDPINSDIVFAATGLDARSPAKSGVYRSLDGAQSWTLVRQVTRTQNNVTTVFQISTISPFCRVGKIAGSA